MPVNTESFQLSLDLGDAAKRTKEVSDGIDSLKDSSAEAAQGLGKLEGAGEKVGVGTVKLTAAQKDAAKASAEMQRGFLSLTNAAQDFQAAGLNGILNNIPQTVAQFGGSAGLAAVIGGVAVGVYAATAAFKGLWAELVAGSNDVPKSTDSLKNLNDELATSKKRLEELGKQRSLSNSELAEFNTLTAKSTELEKASNAEKERRNGLEAARKDENAGNPESAEIVKAAVVQAGGTDSVVNDTLTPMQNESGRLKDAVKGVDDARGKANSAIQNPLNVAGLISSAKALAAAKKELQEAQDEVKAEAETLVLRARQGHEDAVRELARLNPGGSFGQALPESIRASNDEVDDTIEIGENSHKAAAAGRAARNKSAKAKDDDFRLVESLNAEGLGNETALKKQEDDAVKEAEKAAKKADADDAKLNKPVADFDKFADKQQAKLADVRERAGLGIDFKDFANDRGFSPNKNDVAEAAKSMQADMHDNGVSEDQAGSNAMQKLIDKVSKLTEINNRNAAKYNGYDNQVDSLPPVIDPY